MAEKPRGKPLFEGEITMTHEELKILYHVYFFKKNRARAMLMMALGAAATLFGLVRFFFFAPRPFGTTDILLTLLLVLLGITVMQVPFARMRNAVKTVYKQYAGQGKAPKVVQRFYEDGLENQNPGGKTFIAWGKFTRAWRRQGRIVLAAGGNLVSVNPAELTKGSGEELVAFLRGKGLLK